MENALGLGSRGDGDGDPSRKSENSSAPDDIGVESGVRGVKTFCFLVGVCSIEFFFRFFVGVTDSGVGRCDLTVFAFLGVEGTGWAKLLSSARVAKSCTSPCTQTSKVESHSPGLAGGSLLMNIVRIGGAFPSRTEESGRASSVFAISFTMRFTPGIASVVPATRSKSTLPSLSPLRPVPRKSRLTTDPISSPSGCSSPYRTTSARREPILRCRSDKADLMEAERSHVGHGMFEGGSGRWSSMGTNVEHREHRNLLSRPCKGMHRGAGVYDGGDGGSVLGIAVSMPRFSPSLCASDVGVACSDAALTFRFPRFVGLCGRPVGSPTLCSKPSMF